MLKNMTFFTAFIQNVDAIKKLNSYTHYCIICLMSFELKQSCLYCENNLIIQVKNSWNEEIILKKNMYLAVRSKTMIFLKYQVFKLTVKTYNLIRFLLVSLQLRKDIMKRRTSRFNLGVTLKNRRTNNKAKKLKNSYDFGLNISKITQKHTYHFQNDWKQMWLKDSTQYKVSTASFDNFSSIAWYILVFSFIIIAQCFVQIKKRNTICILLTAAHWCKRKQNLWGFLLRAHFLSAKINQSKS